MRILYIAVRILLAVLIYGCSQETPVDNTLYPFAAFNISPLVGSPDTVFNVDASKSYSRSGTILKLRWDWEGDGIWDTAFSTEKTATHKYDVLGYKMVTLEVQNENGISNTTQTEIFITVASKEMILILAGEFLMGSPEGVGKEDEHPQHKVYVDDFYISKYEVTNSQFAEFLNAVGKNDDGFGNRLVNMDLIAIEHKNQIYKAKKRWEDNPVVGVSWYGCMAYAKWAGGRLPTEAEWEKSARGTDARAWPWGNIWDPTKCKSWELEPHGSAPVGSFPYGISPYGVCDIAGNVFEWLADLYQADYYKVSPFENPKGPDSGGFRVLRGGSWVEFADGCRCAFRFGQLPDSTRSDSGFRIAKDK